MKKKENKIAKFLKYAESKIKSLEDSETPFVYFVAMFLSSIILRYFLEMSFMVERWGQVMAEDMPHFLLFYMLAAILIITLFHLATKKDVLKVSKVVLPVFLIINIVPLLANIFALLKPDTPNPVSNI